MMPDEYQVGHEQYSREHALFHTWKAARYYSAFEALTEMLMIETKQHQVEQRVARINVLMFTKQVLDHLIEKELREVHLELTIYFKRKDGLNVAQEETQENQDAGVEVPTPTVSTGEGSA